MDPVGDCTCMVDTFYFVRLIDRKQTMPGKNRLGRGVLPGRVRAAKGQRTRA